MFDSWSECWLGLVVERLGSIFDGGTPRTLQSTFVVLWLPILGIDVVSALKTAATSFHLGFRRGNYDLIKKNASQKRAAHFKHICCLLALETL